MFQEHAEWCEAHPDATPEERKAEWEKWLRYFDAWRMMSDMFAA